MVTDGYQVVYYFTFMVGYDLKTRNLHANTGVIGMGNHPEEIANDLERNYLIYRVDIDFWLQ
jgi:hypothetical protein